MFRKSPSEFNKNVLSQQAELKFKKRITQIYFSLYDQCVYLEDKIKYMPIALPETQSAYDPCITFGSMMVVVNFVCYYLAVLVKDNPTFYSNGELHYQSSYQSCYQPRENRFPFFGAVSNTFSLPVCHTEYREVRALSYFDSLFMCVLFITCIAFIIKLISCIEDRSQNIEDNVKYLILSLEYFLDNSNDNNQMPEIRWIIFEEKIDINDDLINLRKIFEKIKNNTTELLDKNQLMSIVSKIKQHLISQDKLGYFSNNLSEKKTKIRMDSNLYINKVELDKKYKI